MPQIRLYSLFTHETSNSAWKFHAPEEIGPVLFGDGEAATQQGSVGLQKHEWRKGARIIRWLQEHQISAVVIGGYNDAGRVRIIRWCYRNSVPCLLNADSNIRDDTRTGFSAWAKKCFVSRVVRWCDATLVCGTLGRDYFIKYGAIPETIFFYPYEPDYSLISDVTEDAIQRARARFGIKPGRRLIAYSGRLVPVKRVDLLINAFVRIAGDRPDWDLLVIGDGSLKASFQQRLGEPLRGRVFWTGFLDDQPLISALYRASDVLALPSEREPWAVVINEAAAAGLAIVASDVVGAAAELVRDGVNGRIFAHNNADQLTQSLLSVTDPARTNAMKSASKDILADWQRRADPIQGLHKALKFAGVLDKSP